MTILWVLLTIMTSAAAVLMAVPFLRRMDERRDAHREIEIYRDQLREVERDAAAGLIEPAEAEAASLEIKRRLLAADRAGEVSVGALTPLQRQHAVIAICGFVVIGSTILYAVTGSPDVPSGVPASRVTMGSAGPLPTTGSSGGTALPQRHPPVDGQTAQARPLPAATMAQAQQQGSGGSDSALASVDDMIARVLARAEKNPSDVEAWRMVGWSYARTDRHQQAADAYAKAVALKPEDAALQAAYGDELIRASGSITDAGKAAIEKALQLNPKEPRARFIKGMIQSETGDKSAALETWIALLNDANPGDEWEAGVREAALKAAKETGVDISARLPQQKAEGGDTAGDAGGLPALKPLVQSQAPQQVKGPTAADVRNAEAMSPEARQAMIRSMVEGLAERLDKSPRDGDGWIKLIQARRVLGDMDAAKAALDKAVAAFADTPQEQDRIRTAARELGVTQ